MGGLNKGWKLMGQGRSAEVYDIGTNKVLKLFRLDFPKEFAKEEYKVSLNINKNLDISPKVYEVLDIENRAGIVYEKINGITMMKALSLKPWTVKREGKRLAELHKSIQIEVNFELKNCNKSLKDNILRTELLSQDVKADLLEYIDKLPSDNKLCHGDFHPENIIITKDKDIVIDWMTASKGNKLADVARTSIMFKFGVVPNKSYVERKIINLGRKKLYLEYIKNYISITGAKIEDIKKWELPIAAARLVEWLPESEKENLVNFINEEIKKI